jgi:hypothetical protein
MISFPERADFTSSWYTGHCLVGVVEKRMRRNMHFGAFDRMGFEDQLGIKGRISREERSRIPASQQSGAAVGIYISSFTPFER